MVCFDALMAIAKSGRLAIACREPGDRLDCNLLQTLASHRDSLRDCDSGLTGTTTAIAPIRPTNKAQRPKSCNHKRRACNANRAVGLISVAVPVKLVEASIRKEDGLPEHSPSVRPTRQSDVPERTGMAGVSHYSTPPVRDAATEKRRPRHSGIGQLNRVRTSKATAFGWITAALADCCRQYRWDLIQTARDFDAWLFVVVIHRRPRGSRSTTAVTRIPKNPRRPALQPMPTQHMPIVRDHGVGSPV